MSYFFSFFVLGLFSIITQVVILRELTISFYGNEFFIGIILASWLGWVAIGSGLLGSWFKKDRTTLIILYFLFGLFFFLEIFLIRFLKTWIGFPGETPNLIIAGLTALLIPAPLCLILGLWWTIATKIFCWEKGRPQRIAPTVNRAYFIETLGFILGGILFSFFLVHLDIPWFADLRFKGQELIESVNSPYGNIAVTEIKGQYNFYESGLLLGSGEEIQFSEDLIHLSLLQHPSPKKILLIGGGFNGALNEILKHNVQKIYYLELDPKLIEVAQKHISQEFRQALANPKVKIINTDARYFLEENKVLRAQRAGSYFLEENKTKFDLIIVNLPDPSTALINRLYTQEFFKKAKEKLNENGIFITYLSFSSSTPNENLQNLNASIFKTLRQVFSRVIVLPEQTNFFLASSKDLTYDSEVLLERFKQRNIKTKFLNEKYINYRLSNDRIKKTLDSFEKNKTAQINKDFKPVSYFYQTLFFLDHFYPNFSRLFKNFALGFWPIFAGILIISFFFLIKNPSLRSGTLLLRNLKKRNLAKISPLISVAIAGFSLLALEIIFIFAYQIIVGYLYYKIALLITALMVGMALGVWLGNKKIRTSLWPLCHLFLIMFCLTLPLIFLVLPKIPWLLITEIIFLLCAVIAGFLGAIIFPLVNKIYLSFHSQPNKKTGHIYAADLMGACFGAILPSVILIPVFGVFQTLLFIALINLAIILVLILTKNLGCENV